MRQVAFAAVAALALLSACREAADDQANTAAINNAGADAGNTAEASLLGAPVSGEPAKRLMHVRHEGMEDVGDAFKIVTREVKEDTPDLAKVREGAGTIARLAPQVTGWFPPGTGPDVGKTRAKAEIWRKPEDFAAKRKAFQQAAQAFNTAAQGTDLAAIRAAHANLGKNCKACHDPYRSEEKEHE